MAQQEGGWPLGLQPLNVRIGLIRNINYSGSLSLSSFITSSPSSSFATSSDLDIESSGSFFHDQSITLGNLIGVTGDILELNSDNTFRRNEQQEGILAVKNKKKKSHKSKACFSLCNKTQPSGEMMTNIAPSLGYFLEVERRASSAQSTDVVSITYELINGMPAEIQSVREPASTLFSNGVVAPHSQHDNGDEKRSLVLVGDGSDDQSLCLHSAKDPVGLKTDVLH